MSHVVDVDAAADAAGGDDGAGVPSDGEGRIAGRAEERPAGLADVRCADDDPPAFWCVDLEVNHVGDGLP